MADEKEKEVKEDREEKLEKIIKMKKWKFILLAIIFLVLILRENNFENIKEVIIFLPVIAAGVVICWLCDLRKISLYKLPKRNMVKLFTLLLSISAGLFYGFEQFPLSGLWHTRRAVYGFAGVWLFYGVFRWILYPLIYHTSVFRGTGGSLEGYKDYMRKVKEEDEGKE